MLATEVSVVFLVTDSLVYHFWEIVNQIPKSNSSYLVYKLVFQVKLCEKKLLVQFIIPTLPAKNSQKRHVSTLICSRYVFMNTSHFIKHHSLKSWDLIKLKMFTSSSMTFFNKTDFFFFKCVKMNNITAGTFWCHCLNSC